VETLIKLLKHTKAPGLDELRAPVFNSILALTAIFNNCLRTHHFSPVWKHATAVVIPKPGKDPTNPLSYRPISLLSIAGNIFEILSNRLKNFIETSNFPKEQFGFRSERSTLNPTIRQVNLKSALSLFF
jgi:hypothetical protein